MKLNTQIIIRPTGNQKMQGLHYTNLSQNQAPFTYASIVLAPALVCLAKTCDNMYGCT
jgi:hypothetical protein